MPMRQATTRESLTCAIKDLRFTAKDSTSDDLRYLPIHPRNEGTSVGQQILMLAIAYLPYLKALCEAFLAACCRLMQQGRSSAEFSGLLSKDPLSGMQGHIRAILGLW